MEDMSGLAARVAASVSDLRGCLILDRDGLVLGAYPEGQEATIKSSWLRFAGLGEAEKGFIEFGDVMWAFVRRGPYAAFAVSGTQARPGFVMDQLEQILFAAEEVRSRRDALRLPDVAPAPSSRPRTPLHPEARPTSAGATGTPSDAAPASASPAAGGTPPVRPPVRPSPSGGPPAVSPRTGPSGAPPQGPPGVRPQAAPARPASGPTAEPSPAPGPASGSEAAPSSSPAVSSSAAASRSEPSPSAPTPEAAPSVATPRPEPPPAASKPGSEPAAPPPTPANREEDGEVDPVLLAQEFSRLLQETAGGDET